MTQGILYPLVLLSHFPVSSLLSPSSSGKYYHASASTSYKISERVSNPPLVSSGFRSVCTKYLKALIAIGTQLQPCMRHCTVCTDYLGKYICEVHMILELVVVYEPKARYDYFARYRSWGFVDRRSLAQRNYSHPY